jgi:hypothetical protein
MKQALMLAVFGAFLCPVVAQVASLVMIWGTSADALTPPGKKRRRWALIVDLVVLGIATFLALT